MRLTRWTIVAALTLAAASCGKPGSRPVDRATAVATKTAAAGATRPSAQPDRFVPGDLLLLKVYFTSIEPNAVLTVPVRVQADGTIEAPLLPVMSVAGMDRVTLERAVAAAFGHCFTSADPPVTVARLQVADDGGPTPGPIGVGDLVRCAVNGLSLDPMRPTVIVRRVDAGGTFDLPYVGPVHVAGVSEGAAARAVAQGYRDANVLAGAQVSVLILERAPADAAHRALPDEPVQPVPEPLRFLYESR